jgi:hypothetical protein
MREQDTWKRKTSMMEVEGVMRWGIDVAELNPVAEGL